MALTSVENVLAILAPGIASQVDAALCTFFINDAAAIVSQYQIVRSGVASENSIGSLKDSLARYHDWVVPGATVRNLASGKSTTVATVVSATELSLSDAGFVFSAGDAYEIEDLQRRERAERYKAAALIFERLSPTAQGWETVRLGPASISTGEFASDTALDRTLNVYEAEFRQIVGFHTEAA